MIKAQSARRRTRASRHGRATRSGNSRVAVIAVIVVIAAVAAWKFSAAQGLLNGFGSGDEGEADSRYILHEAEMGSFRITITENGTVSSLKNATLKNSVEGTTTIITLVPEGSQVNGPVESEIDGVVEFVDTESDSEKTVRVRGEDGEEKLYSFTMGEFTELLVEDRQQIKKGDYIAGDMLCELDSSTLVDKEKQSQIDVTTARADLEKAEKNLEIQKTTNESLLAQARLAEELAQLDLEKYVAEGGEYQQAVEKIQGEIKQFEEELSIAQEDYEKVRDQARRGYTNLNNLETARITVSQKKILLDVKKSELKLLEKFTFRRTKAELEQTAEDSKRETQRAILEGEAALAGLKADFDARKLTLSVVEENLAKTVRQIEACRLIAPQQGEVVYASQQSRRSEPVVIEEGATVRERQDIIHLPDLDLMKIDARIHESRISRIMIGQSVEISIDALPTITFHGILENVSSVPVPGNWPNTDLKEYEAEIRITDSKELVRKLKPGMTAEIRIIVDDREDDVLQIPVQSVLTIADRFFTYVVSGKNVERRELKIGDGNDEYIEILDGVETGEKVVMNPRTHFSREINELEVRLLGEQEDNRERTKVLKKPAPDAAGPGGQRPPAAAGAQQGGAPTGGAQTGGAQTGESQGGAGRAGGPPDPQAIMDRLDKNKDGVITKDEGDMRGNFDKLDADGDGKLTLEEIKNGFANR